MGTDALESGGVRVAASFEECHQLAVSLAGVKHPALPNLPRHVAAPRILLHTLQRRHQPRALGPGPGPCVRRRLKLTGDRPWREGGEGVLELVGVVAPKRGGEAVAKLTRPARCPGRDVQCRRQGDALLRRQVAEAYDADATQYQERWSAVMAKTTSSTATPARVSRRANRMIRSATTAPMMYVRLSCTTVLRPFQMRLCW